MAGEALAAEVLASSIWVSPSQAGFRELHRGRVKIGSLEAVLRGGECARWDDGVVRTIARMGAGTSDPPSCAADFLRPWNIPKSTMT